MSFLPIREKIFSRFENEISKNVIYIAWPVLIELLLGSLFSMLDMMMLGQLPKSESAASVAAVGITNQPLFLGLAVIQALNVGGTAMVARYVGQKKTERVASTVKHIILINMFIVVPIVIWAQINARTIMSFMGAEQQTIDIGINYFRVIMYGFIFQGFNSSLFAVLRGVGDTKIPMKINIKVNGFNVVGNALLIYGLLFFPQMGVTGAGISTLLSHVIALIMLISYFIRGKTKIKIDFKERFYFDKNIIFNFIKIGVPSSLEQLGLRLGMLLYVKIVASLGTIVYASHQICINILGLSFTTGQAFSIAASSLTGRTLGEGEPKKAEQYVLKCRQLGSILSSVIALVLFFFGKQILSLYTKDNDIINSASIALKIIAVIQPFQSSAFVLAGALRGAGDTVFPLISTTIGIVGIRVVFAYIFVNFFNLALPGAWIAMLLDQVFRWLLIYLRFKSGKWKTIKLR
ncbi:MAG: MATE family efflux transporter [Clostridium argentinense]|uniref:Probable multidrug resistance protein NorM n=1 Tax=Clostridium faecium TaxID=2762223 RepID=A0ABR8YRF3_9CLOT|nr:MULTISPECIES: MATE family efflux transporter [Clostridium]MBD8046805.1 MATE family efflux transporter [Clostridium faecium]MBS5824496.1 MATE family efflux transporter [Clostridium argentinense]MDU1350480.1 MATE family efflux transporter [Clostridium argentinense]